MLATWLVEFYLNKCNELDDLVASESVSQDVVNLHAERAIVEEDLKQFLSTYKVRTVGDGGDTISLTWLYTERARVQNHL